jgi:hypothetical protein
MYLLAWHAVQCYVGDTERTDQLLILLDTRPSREDRFQIESKHFVQGARKMVPELEGLRVN